MIEDLSVVFTDAEAGTGKTAVAVRKGVELLRQGKISRIHYVRFPDKRSLKLGFLAGNYEKEAGYMYPFYEAMQDCGVQEEAVMRLITAKYIDTSTDIHLRGRNMRGTYLIIDEAQNAGDLTDLKLVLTRIHDHRGKAVVIGHSKQTDSRVELYTKHKLNAFQVNAFHFSRKPWAGRAHLRNNYRGEISKWADRVEESLVLIENMAEFG
jgi:phosphate starvation-inducible protein PhoH